VLLSPLCSVLPIRLAAYILLENITDMKRFTLTERGGLILAAFLFVGGLFCLVWPQDGVVVHPTNDALGLRQMSSREEVSKTGARAYGILAMLLGSCLAIVVIYPRKI